MLADIDSAGTSSLDENQLHQLTLAKTKGKNLLTMLGVADESAGVDAPAANARQDIVSEQVNEAHMRFLAESAEDRAESIKNNVPLLIEKLKLLRDACASLKANEAAKILAAVKGISIDENIDASLSVIAQQINELDYDKASVRIGMLLTMLKFYGTRSEKK
jgi:hypothetical protein